MKDRISILTVNEHVYLAVVSIRPLFFLRAVCYVRLERRLGQKGRPQSKPFLGKAEGTEAVAQRCSKYSWLPVALTFIKQPKDDDLQMDANGWAKLRFNAV